MAGLSAKLAFPLGGVRRTALVVADTVSVVDIGSPFELPSVILISPANGSINDIPDSAIVLQISGGYGYAANIASLQVVVNGDTVFTGGAAIAGWSSSARPADNGTRVTLFPVGGFAYGEHVALTVSFDYSSLVEPASRGDALSVTDTVTIEKASFLGDSLSAVDTVSLGMTLGRVKADSVGVADAFSRVP